jgi:phosphoribosylaminoimidazolecarboxamide formyltransferase/IMP cyclohydrolase
VKFRNALVSVSDKTGLLEFIRPLAQQGTRIVSTGGTAKLLRNAGVAVIDVSDQTGFPEVMDGRVKTLHPNIHMALLARTKVPEDLALLKSSDLEVFDLVVGNLYPFAEGLKKNLPLDEQVELIDIGGPSFLRSAAKSFERLVVLCDPRDYTRALENDLTLGDRRHLAAKVFAHTSCYDSLVSQYLSSSTWLGEYSLAGNLKSELRYGENPQQKANWYANPKASGGLHDADQVQGKDLSFNNLLDLDAAVQTLREFKSPACVAVKHNNPCGVATAQNLNESVERAIKADPVSVFGGIVAVNGPVNAKIAELLSELFLECIVAPSYEPAALQVLAKKKKVRVLAWEKILERSNTSVARTIDGGFLLQEVDQCVAWDDAWQVIGGPVNLDQRPQYSFAWQVCSRLKSNAIAICGNSQTLGLGMGQVNRVDAVQQAIGRWKTFHPQITKNVVMASDAFFPFADSIEIAHAAGVRYIIQPGGSIRDREVIEKAQALGIQMVLTGRRHFLH